MAETSLRCGAKMVYQASVDARPFIPKYMKHFLKLQSCSREILDFMSLAMVFIYQLIINLCLHSLSATQTTPFAILLKWSDQLDLVLENSKNERVMV